ncbi:hypothetical protein P8452_21894 [Trifolium repens]|nr:Rad21/Rec8 family protein [Trifolium repens]WJX33714.1 hypothetical protein P8452_21894 [Trifolium repens]
MFYSQTFLARKGPLSTVWIAAHLQHRLKKSQCASTDIPSTVQHILDPGVPIALRMSAHLLLGVVRIYSKKVDYLLSDCNAVRTVLYKVFPSVPNNTLPEDARQAPVHSITMPATFDLDMLDVDCEIDINGHEDGHTRSQEDITMPDQNPIRDNYEPIRFDEGETSGFFIAQPTPDSEQPPPDAEQPPTQEVIIGDGSLRRESHNTNPIGDDNPPIFPDPNTSEAMPVEAFRNTSTDHDTIGNLPNPECNDTEPNSDFNQTGNEDDPIVEMTEVPAETPSIQPTGPPTPVSIHAEGASDAQVNGGGISQQTFEHNFGIIPSPQIEQRQDQGQDQRNQRGRKRKFIDDHIVLTNEFMRKTLNDTRKIRRKRKDVTTSTFGNWELKSKRLKEDIFDQPLITGLCKELINIRKREYILSKPHLVISNTTNPIVDEPMPNAPEIIADPSGVKDIERFCSDVITPPPVIPTHRVDTEPIIEGTNKSPARRDVATPTLVSGTVEIPHGATSSHAHVSEIGSASTYQDTIIHNYDIPNTNQLINSPEKEDLYFLEEENNTPATASSQGTSKSISTLSGRSRGVAQYLRDYSPCTPIPEQPAEDLSLNKILDGKTRKIAARMFFEVLVLKTHNLIDVKQEEPYDDVSIKLTPTLSKAKI